jgi:Major Facilitator Superfamily
VALRFCCRRSEWQPVFVDRKNVRLGKDHRTFHNVLQFADVSRPGTRLKYLKCSLLDLLEVLARSSRIAIGWQTIWHWLGIASLIVGVLLLVITPSETPPQTGRSGWASVLRPYSTVFRNPQSYLCGVVAGLLFVPTTIGDMTWGVAFFQRDRMLSFHDAVVTGSLVPLGWVIGCPLLGWLADFVGRRKPVLIGGAVAMLLSAADITFSTGHTAAAIGCFLFGIASGATMIPYTIIKEVNPDEVKGSATGGINFLTFGVTALIGPIFANLLGKGFATTQNHLAHFRASGIFWITGIALAIVLSMFLRETGHARKIA